MTAPITVHASLWVNRATPIRFHTGEHGAAILVDGGTITVFPDCPPGASVDDQLSELAATLDAWNDALGDIIHARRRAAAAALCGVEGRIGARCALAPGHDGSHQSKDGSTLPFAAEVAS